MHSSRIVHLWKILDECLVFSLCPVSEGIFTGGILSGGALFLHREAAEMLGMPTLAVGISCQRNRGPVPAKKKYSNRVSPRKDNFFFTFLHGAGKPAWPRTVGRIFETSVQMVLGEIVAQCTCAQTNNCRKEFQMVLGEIVAKTRLFQIISKG